jgi:AmmeMemoRadiSam system protein A
MDPYLELAQKTIITYLNENKIIEPEKNLPKEMLEKKAGVFVSLHQKSDHSLRGCIGTFLPTQDNIAQEIIHNAISASVDDPRFNPLSPLELADLEISVDVLSEPERIKNINELDSKKYGIIIKSADGRTGLLLPDIEGVKSVDEQISIACQKAGISPPFDKFSIFRFTVERHK